MENTSVTPVNVVVIGSYMWDDTHIDDNRAYYTTYTLFFPELRKITTATESTGFGGDLFKEHPEYNVVEYTDELKALYAEVLEENRLADAKAKLAEYQKEIDEYNASLRPQEKGQRVEILAGRRKGKICKISWIGKGRKFGYDISGWYAKTYPMAAALLACIKYRPYSIPAKDYDTIRVWPEDGTDPFYISIDKAKVIEGFKPVTITLDDVYKKGRDFDDSFSRKWRNGYNCSGEVA